MDTPNKDEMMLQGLMAMFEGIALQGLGKAVRPEDGKISVDLQRAEYAIDMLTMLHEKTKGNVTTETTRVFMQQLHFLKMNFIDVKKEFSKQKQNAGAKQKTSKVSKKEESPKPADQKEKPTSKRTPFYDFHKTLKAKIVPFAGFEMLVQYEGIVKEHLHVRSKVGVFDVSHMGEFYVSGKDAAKFVSFVTCNDPSELDAHGVQYSAFLNENGGIVDDLLVYRRAEGYLLVVNAGNLDKDWAWVNKQKGSFEITLENQSDATAQLAIQGPQAQQVTEALTGLKLEAVGFYESRDLKFDGEPILLSRTGYTGEDGFEMYFNKSIASKVWNKLFEVGKEYDLKPIGLGARDTLRLEMKYCLHGNDISEQTSPLEAGLGWIVKLKKESFIGKDFLLKQKKQKVQRKLVCMVMNEKAIPRAHCKIYSTDDQEIGEVTSGTISPSLGKGIALGYVKRGFTKIGTNLFIEIGMKKKKRQAEIVKPPFYKHGTHK